METNENDNKTTKTTISYKKIVVLSSLSSTRGAIATCDGNSLFSLFFLYYFLSISTIQRHFSATR